MFTMTAKLWPWRLWRDMRRGLCLYIQQIYMYNTNWYFIFPSLIHPGFSPPLPPHSCSASRIWMDSLGVDPSIYSDLRDGHVLLRFRLIYKFRVLSSSKQPIHYLHHSLYIIIDWLIEIIYVVPFTMSVKQVYIQSLMILVPDVQIMCQAPW